MKRGHVAQLIEFHLLDRLACGGPGQGDDVSPLGGGSRETDGEHGLICLAMAAFHRQRGCVDLHSVAGQRLQPQDSRLAFEQERRSVAPADLLFGMEPQFERLRLLQLDVVGDDQDIWFQEQQVPLESFEAQDGRDRPRWRRRRCSPARGSTRARRIRGRALTANGCRALEPLLAFTQLAPAVDQQRIVLAVHLDR